MTKNDAYGVYFIFKSMEQGSSFRVAVPKYPTGEGDPYRSSPWACREVCRKAGCRKSGPSSHLTRDTPTRQRLCLHRRYERLGPAAQPPQNIAESVERHCQIWRERFGAHRGENAIEIGRLFRRRARLFATPELGHRGGEIVERHGQIRPERFGPRGILSARRESFLSSSEGAQPLLRPLHLVVRETEFCGLRLAGYFRRRMPENSRNSVRRPRCASLTRRNYGGFCRPGNRPGLSGLDGGGRSPAEPVCRGRMCRKCHFCRECFFGAPKRGFRSAELLVFTMR